MQRINPGTFVVLSFGLAAVLSTAFGFVLSRVSLDIPLFPITDPTSADFRDVSGFAGGNSTAAANDSEFGTESPLDLGMLKTQHGVVIHGTIAIESERQRLLDSLGRRFPAEDLHDWMQVVDNGRSPISSELLEFLLDAFELEDVRTIRATSANVEISGKVSSVEERKELSESIDRMRPPDIETSYKILAPRKKIYPYETVVHLSGGTATFLECFAEDDIGRTTIVGAAAEAGLVVEGECELGLGAPSRNWPEAIATAIGILVETGDGTLIARGNSIWVSSSDQADGKELESRTGEYLSRMPPEYRLSLKPTSSTTARATTDQDSSWVQIVLGKDRGVEISGTLPNIETSQVIGAVAKVELNTSEVSNVTLIDPEESHPEIQSILLAILALTKVFSGDVLVTEDHVFVSGITAVPAASREIMGLLSRQLDPGSFTIDLEYDGTLSAPKPASDPNFCMSQVNDVLDKNKLSFRPGSAELWESGYETIEQLAKIFEECSHVKMEIGGHTDNQGRESMNLRLSEERARAVLDALLANGVSARNLTVKGYGESEPIVENSTEEGRERNRRIEFRLIELDTARPR